MWEHLLIPEELAQLPHWTAHKNKRPLVNPDQPQNGTPLRSQQSEHVGLILAKTNDIAIIDIDHPKTPLKKRIAQLSPSQWGSDEHLQLLHQELIPSIPPQLLQLLPHTYAEFSPSGAGLHIVVRTDNKYKAYVKAKTFNGQLSMYNCFMTFTNHPWPGCSLTKIAQLPPDLFTPAPTEDDNEVFEAKPPTWSTLKKAVQLLAIDQNPRLLQVYEQVMGYAYEHYQYWLEIGMALHNYGTVTNTLAQCYNVYLEWSAQDPVAFSGQEEVYSKWQSFSKKETPITWRTLFKLANRLDLDYPRQTLVKGVPTGNPVTCEYSNFEYLLERFNLELFEDDGFYVTGDKDICDRYFLAHGATSWFQKYYGPFTANTLQGSVLLMCQDHRWRGMTTASHLVSTWLTRPRGTFDLFTTWLDTPLDQHPDELQHVITKTGRHHVSKFDANSTFEYLASCVTLDRSVDQDEALCYEMIRKQLMHIIKFREDIELPFVDNGGMLIFIGPENTRKSTFFRMLLPKGLGQMRKEMNMAIKGEKGMRDFVRYLGKKVIVQVDEFEGLMNHAKDGSIFKAIISGDSASMTDIYQTTETEMPRRAIIVGTSNERHQVLSDNGTRRMWMCQVSHVDTDKMLQINWHTFYRRLRDEFRTEYLKGQMPWLLSQQQINQLNVQNRGLAAKTDLSIMLEQTFPYTAYKTDLSDITSIQTDQTGQLLTTKAVFDILKFDGHNMNSVKLVALERALERYCGEYTGSQGLTLEIQKPRGTLRNGRLQQGKYKLWVMPKRAL